MKNIAIFASGSGSNAQAIAEYLKNKVSIQIGCILSNNPNAYVLERAKLLDIPSYTFSRNEYNSGTKIQDILKKHSIDLIVLAGFLWLIPGYLIKLYPQAIINIHPALLPKYGGKGMYGMRVHESVIQNGESESGITIHYVNENYDEGAIIFQAKCPVTPEDTPDRLAKRIHELEYKHYSGVICDLVNRISG